MAKEILRMEDVTKIYDNGFVANKNVTFWLHESEILALWEKTAPERRR